MWDDKKRGDRNWSAGLMQASPAASADTVGTSMKHKHAIPAELRRRRWIIWTCRALCTCLLAWTTFSNAALAQEATATKIINLLEISTGPAGTSTTFYASNDQGWGAPSCPAATWGYFYSDRTNAKEMFALLMFAKQMGKAVQLVGTCTSPSYFNVIQVLTAN